MRALSRALGLSKVFFVMYLFGLAGSIPLGFKIIYDDNHWEGAAPHFATPQWFYPAFIFGVPLLIGLLGVGVFLFETRYRKNDPYRFSRKQYRFIEVESKDIPIISNELIKLGYYIFSEFSDEHTYRVEGGRVKISNLTRFTERKHPSPFRIYINAQLTENIWKVIIEAVPVSSLAVADFRNTIFDSLEELVDELGWRIHLKNSNWEPTERN